MMLGTFKYRGVLLVWIIVGHGHTLLAVGAGEVICIFLFF